MEAIYLSAINDIKLRDASQWAAWKFRVKVLLKAAGVSSIVDGSSPRPDEAKEEFAAWANDDAKAQNLIVSRTGEMDKNMSRKMLQGEMEEVKKKVYRENQQLIALQMKQDTVFWEQKEKHAALKADHERLQHNTFKLQMENESLSGQLQNELRHRPEVINKCEATREICDTVHKTALLCKQKFTAMQKDNEAICAAYHKGDQMLAEMKMAQLKIRDSYEQNVKDLRYKLKIMTEHQDQLKAFYHDRTQRNEAEINQLREVNNVLASKAEEQKWKLENANSEIEKRGAYISNIKKELDNLIQEASTKLNEAVKENKIKDNELKTALDEIESIKKALNNQEALTKSLCDEKSSLLEQLAVAEEECQRAVAANESYAKSLEDIKSVKEALEKKLDNLIAEHEALKKDRDDKQGEIHLCEQELERSAKQLAYQHTMIDKLTSDLANLANECQEKTTQITKLQEEKETLTRNLNEVQNAFTSYRNEVNDEKNNLNAAIEEKNVELEQKANAISMLTTELQNLNGEREKLESELRNMTIEKEMETEKATEVQKELQDKVSELERDIRKKEEAMAIERSKYLQEKVEHEKVISTQQETISDLEKRIANVMKEAAGAAPAPRFTPPDTDCLLSPPRKSPLANVQVQDSMLAGYFDSLVEDTTDRRDFLMTPSPVEHSTPKRRRRADKPADKPADKTADKQVVDRRPLADLSANIVKETPLPSISEWRFFKTRKPTSAADKPKKKRAMK